jgi:RNA polymerase sigma-70 factor (ECF subfamily)
MHMDARWGGAVVGLESTQRVMGVVPAGGSLPHAFQVTRMSATATDAELAAAFAAGDRASGDALFARHEPALRAYLCARSRDADTAAELTQEVAWRLVAAAARLDPARDVRGYLFRTAANVWRDHLRRELVRRRAAPQLVAEHRVAAAESSERLVLDAELTEAVARAIAALPRTQRDVLELRHHHGLTFQAIATRLARPLGTVLTQMRAALAKVGASLEDYR